MKLAPLPRKLWVSAGRLSGESLADFLVGCRVGEEKGFKMSGGHFMPGDIIRTNVTEAEVKDIWERRKIYEQIRAIATKDEKLS